jgi:hypothetical protein
MTAFWEDHNVKYLKEYLNIIRASISRPSVLLKRQMTELWTNTFYPWIAKVLNTNMDLKFILDEYSCAACVMGYVNKINRGISNLHRELIKLQNEYPDQDYTSLLKGVSLRLLNNVEMRSQEAAWYLLRQPMSEASRDTVSIRTCWPHVRQKMPKRPSKWKRKISWTNLQT